MSSFSGDACMAHGQARSSVSEVVLAYLCSQQCTGTEPRGLRLIAQTHTFAVRHSRS